MLSQVEFLVKSCFNEFSPVSGRVRIFTALASHHDEFG
jgi:hypothetical protein